MEVNLQQLNFDLEGTRARLDRLERDHPDLAGAIRTVTVGDFSCQYRNQHTLAALADGGSFDAFAETVRGGGRRLLYQLPLVIKEFEFRSAVDLVRRLWDHVDGFVTGDLGVLRVLHRWMDECGEDRAVVFTSNVINRRYAALLRDRFRIAAIRPLFHKRTFIEHDVGLDKDVVVYGNLMINASVFCFHCGDLPTKCDYSCAAPKELVMENERMKLVGRSLITTNRLDLLDRLPHIAHVASATVMDLDLTDDEVVYAVRRIRDAGGTTGAAVTGPAPA